MENNLRLVLKVEANDDKDTFVMYRKFKDNDEMYSTWVGINKNFIKLVAPILKTHDDAIKMAVVCLTDAIKEIEAEQKKKEDK